MSTVLQFPALGRATKERAIQQLESSSLGLFDQYQKIDEAYEHLNELEAEAAKQERVYNEALKALVRVEQSIETIEQDFLALSTLVKIDVIEGKENWYLQSITVDGVTYAQEIEGYDE